MRPSIVLLSLVIGCSTVSGGVVPSPTAIAHAARANLGATTGIVVLINPATCGFGPELGATLRQLSDEAHVPALVIFFGVFPDSATHARARDDFELSIPSRLMGAQAVTESFGVPPGGAPTLIVIKRGELVLRVHGSSVGRLERWLPQFLGVPQTSITGG